MNMSMHDIFPPGTTVTATGVLLTVPYKSNDSYACTIYVDKQKLETDLTVVKARPLIGALVKHRTTQTVGRLLNHTPKIEGYGDCDWDDVVELAEDEIAVWLKAQELKRLEAVDKWRAVMAEIPDDLLLEALFQALKLHVKTK